MSKAQRGIDSDTRGATHQLVDDKIVQPVHCLDWQPESPQLNATHLDTTMFGAVGIIRTLKTFI